ncbi:MAG: helix-turn-helix domain-containing protein [Desulfitobacteriaceae bacterium]
MYRKRKLQAEAARILGIPRSSLYYKMNILKMRQKPDMKMSEI